MKAVEAEAENTTRLAVALISETVQQRHVQAFGKPK